MINWRCVKTDGLPNDANIGYLVSDGKNIEFSDINIQYKDPYSSKQPKEIRGVEFIGGSVYAVYEEVSGTEFDFDVQYWCPVSELNLPNAT